MFRISSYIACCMMLLLLVFCNSKPVQENNAATNDSIPISNIEQTKVPVVDIAGSYVSDGYKQREQGYDWVGATVVRIDSNRITIKIRSRADQKKPTCTVDFLAIAKNDSTYESNYQEKQVIFQFTPASLRIEPARPDGESALYFFCSGGATVAGTYAKIPDSLDQAQVDNTIFQKNLTLQGIGFNVFSKPEQGKVKITIQPYGLKINNDPITEMVQGRITDAEIEDMNADGYPEVLVYIETNDVQKKGNVVAISVNRGNSASRVYFPDIATDQAIASEYQGQDEFNLVENSLVRRFPIIYNGKVTGKTREIVYKLKEGEAMRKLTPVKSTIF